VRSPRRCSPSWSVPRSGCCAPCLPPSPTWTGAGCRATGERQGQAAGAPAAHRRGQPGPGRGRGRPDPGPRWRRRARQRRVRRHARHPSLRQEQGRRLPVGGQHQSPAGAEHPLPATRGIARRGQPSCMPTPADAASTTPTPSASWPAPGYGSSGPAGTPTPSMTPPSTAPRNASPPELDSGNSSAELPSARPSSAAVAPRCRPATTSLSAAMRWTPRVRRASRAQALGPAPRAGAAPAGANPRDRVVASEVEVK
jgi:hypothetical protein